jgi:formylglycine-generating enzyme required for sulfatase activity
MEEGGAFCEHCGARANVQARPPTVAHAVGGVLERQQAREAGNRPSPAASAPQPAAGTGAGGYEASEDKVASDDPDGAAAESDWVETAPYGEATLEEDEEASGAGEESERVAYVEAASDFGAPHAGAVAKENEGAAPLVTNPPEEIRSAAQRPAGYGEPRSFAYGQPLPTFGLNEEAESTEKPEGRAGRRWIAFGGAGLAVLALAVVTATVLFRQPSPADELRPSPDAGVTAGDAPAQSQPAPPDGMVYVPGGKFLMGRDGGDDYERPRHEANVTPFFIDKYEVTREEYQKFVDATGHAPRGWAGGKFPEGTGRWPVTGVNWADAVAYAKWVGKRLPTEAEWEYAARGADGRIYPWGNEWQGGLANADDSARKGIAPVGEFKGASPFGLFDMVGNAWEWTSNVLQAYPGGRLPKQQGRDLRVIRGGSWQSDRSAATTTYRWGWPAEGAEDYSNTSFRCVKDVAADKR